MISQEKKIPFSILVPVYNVERYLDACVQSVLSQTYGEHELILVNDGSTDRSGQLCDAYAEKDSRIRVFHKANAGPLHTRQYALEQAVGEYCVFLDSDDYLETNALERLAAIIRETHSDCVIFGVQDVSEGQVLSVSRESEDRLITDKRELYLKCVMSSVYNSLCRKAVKTDLLKGIDYSAYYHIKHGEDLLQSLDVLKNSRKVAFVQDVLYNYRVNPQSITRAITHKDFTLDNTVRETVLAFLKKENVFTPEDLEQYRGYCARLLSGKIYIIAGLDTTVGEKKRLLKAIGASDYYRHFVNAGPVTKEQVGHKHIVYRLFKSRRYGLLIFMVWLLKMGERWRKQ